MKTKLIQLLLAALSEKSGNPGLSPGAVDGIWGAKTQAAVDAFWVAFGTPGGLSSDEATINAISHAICYGLSDDGGTGDNQTPTADNPSPLGSYLQSDGYYHIPKSESIQLSKHFNSSEFRCGLGRPCNCTETIINPKLVDLLQDIRDHFGRPLTITSAYRCPDYNRSAGGATGSRHTKGDAADITVNQTTPRSVARYAEEKGINGIGLYETGADGYFVHVDTRDAKSFWYGQSQDYRNTFK